MAQRKGVADWPSLGQWPMAGRNVDDMHFQAVAAARIIGRQALTGLALAHEYDTAFWWTVGIFASGAVIAGALLRLARWVSRARPRHMPRRRRLLKARQTPPGVIPEHFRRQTRRVVKASGSEECSVCGRLTGAAVRGRAGLRRSGPRYRAWRRSCADAC